MKSKKQFSLDIDEVKSLLCALQVADLRPLENKQILICEELRDCFSLFLDEMERLRDAKL